jgi:hypothetical protein
MKIEEAERIRQDIGMLPGATAHEWAIRLYDNASFDETGTKYWERNLEAYAVLHAADIVKERNRLLDLARRLANHVGDVWGCSVNADCGECHLQKDDKSGCKRYDDAHYAMQALLKEAEEILKEKPWPTLKS